MSLATLVVAVAILGSLLLAFVAGVTGAVLAVVGLLYIAVKRSLSSKAEAPTHSGFVMPGSMPPVGPTYTYPSRES